MTDGLPRAARAQGGGGGAGWGARTGRRRAGQVSVATCGRRRVRLQTINKRWHDRISAACPEATPEARKAGRCGNGINSSGAFAPASSAHSVVPIIPTLLRLQPPAPAVTGRRCQPARLSCLPLPGDRVAAYLSSSAYQRPASALAWNRTRPAMTATSLSTSNSLAFRQILDNSLHNDAYISPRSPPPASQHHNLPDHLYLSPLQPIHEQPPSLIPRPRPMDRHTAPNAAQQRLANSTGASAHSRTQSHTPSTSRPKVSGTSRSW